MIRVADGVLHVEGPLGLASAAELLREGHEAIAGGARMVDLSAVTQGDSAGLALLLDWARAARQRGGTLELRALPDALASLASLYGIGELLTPAA
jgi:phospholipid transport system transporter-binding protein